MKTAILALTVNGSALAYRLQNTLKADVYVPERFYRSDSRGFAFKGRVNEQVAAIFDQYDALVFIMAAGIVVRSIAPLLKSKKTDPAVVVMDEKGRNVISLLSGHVGGANGMAVRIAGDLGANPVITTASDVNETLAVDMLAQRYGCVIENEQFLTAIAAAIVNDEKVAFYSEWETEFELGGNIVSVDALEDITPGFSGGVFLTVKTVPELDFPYVVLRPKNVILGMGCRKGVSEQHLREAVRVCLESSGISEKCIKHIATVDIKKDEEGLVRLAESLKVPLRVVEREDIRKVEAEFPCSEFVRESIGVGCVAEPAAMLTSENGVLLGGKFKFEGVTVAVVVERMLESGPH